MAGIDNLTAALLSNSAYTDLSTFQVNGGSVPDLTDWNVDLSLSVAKGDNQFIVFVNQTTQQVVVGFKGTNTPSQLVSDLVNDGGANWEGLRSAFATSLAQIQAQHPGYVRAVGRATSSDQAHSASDFDCRQELATAIDRPPASLEVADYAFPTTSTTASKTCC